MKTKSKIGTVALVVGMLSALSAQAGSGLIKVTHSDTPYTGKYPSAPAKAADAPVAKAQPAVKQAKASEVQVAVMASSPAQYPPRRSVFIHR